MTCSRAEPVADLEHLAAAAWPAAERLPLGPWTLRATAGVTSRANSALPVPLDGAGGDVDAERLIDETEAFYGARGLPPIVQVSPAAWPPDLDARLERRGWRLDSPTEVWTAPVAAVAARCGTSPPDAAIAARPDATWLDLAYGEEPPARRAIRESIVARITAPAAFASVVDGGRTAACGMAVAAHGWAGIFSMRTLPEARGRGHGTRILGALARWAQAAGAARLYLQVDAANAAARGLYARSGFAPAYRYHFRVGPPR